MMVNDIDDGRDDGQWELVAKMFRDLYFKLLDYEDKFLESYDQVR